jgi:hypothetical protein
MSAAVILLVIALILLILATLNVSSPVNLMAAAGACVVLAILLDLPLF